MKANEFLLQEKKKILIDSFTAPHNFSWFPDPLKPMDGLTQAKKHQHNSNSSRISSRYGNFRAFTSPPADLIKKASLSFSCFIILKNQGKLML